MPTFFWCAQDRDRRLLDKDMRSDRDLGDRTALSHARVGWAAFGTEHFKRRPGARFQAQFASGDPDVLRIAYVELGQGRGHIPVGGGYAGAELECRVLAKSLRYEPGV